MAAQQKVPTVRPNPYPIVMDAAWPCIRRAQIDRPTQRYRCLWHCLSRRVTNGSARNVDRSVIHVIWANVARVCWDVVVATKITISAVWIRCRKRNRSASGGKLQPFYLNEFLNVFC